MAVNLMGPVIFTSHLLPLLKKTASPSCTVRIVNQSSSLHAQSPSDTKFASLEELNQDLGPNSLYSRAKLAVLLYSRYLARHLTGSNPNILVNATHPGFVESKMSREDIHEPYPILGYVNSVAMKPFKKDQFQACVSAMYAATKATTSGQYICPPAIPEPGSALSQDEELGERLMKLTREVIQKKTYEESAAKGCPFADY
jgi:NAD(P)-dependent dehydrogenase (short-subunit alcohol dehydrogenase family)